MDANDQLGENKNRELKKQLSASNRKVERLEEELEEVKLELEEEREEKQALKDEIEYLSNELEETHRSEEVTRVCLVCQEDGHDPSDYNYI
jgi:chromosome segregation ATPase